MSSDYHSKPLMDIIDRTPCKQNILTWAVKCRTLTALDVEYFLNIPYLFYRQRASLGYGRVSHNNVFYWILKTQTYAVFRVGSQALICWKKEKLGTHWEARWEHHQCIHQFQLWFIEFSCFLFMFSSSSGSHGCRGALGPIFSMDSPTIYIQQSEHWSSQYILSHNPP